MLKVHPFSCKWSCSSQWLSNSPLCICYILLVLTLVDPCAGSLTGCYFGEQESSKMSSKTASANSTAQAKRTVQQLRLEASIERIKVSKASADLMSYCEEHARSDPLLMGIPTSENPFKDKKTCIIL